MAPKKQKRAASESSSAASPTRQRVSSPGKRGKAARSSSRGTTQKRKVTWRLLPLDTMEASSFDFNVDDEEEGVDVHEDNAFTAHCDATVRAAAMADWVQQGASEEGHIDDVVAVNDLFVAKMDEAVEKVDLGVVQELEVGSVPEEILPAPVSSLFKQKGEQCGGSKSERDVAAKVQAEKDLDGLWEAWGVQQREKDEATVADDDGAESTHQDLKLGAIFASMQAAEHFVRIQSRAPLRVVPGMSKKCRVWCCRSNKAADKADGSRANPAADGSRATSLQSCGCNAIVQVRTHMSLHMYLTVCDQSLQSHFFGLS